MSNLEENLLILKRKKLTAKTIVDQQRNEIRILKSSASLNEQIEAIWKKFDGNPSVDVDLLKKIFDFDRDKLRSLIDELSILIEQIQRFLSIDNDRALFQSDRLDFILNNQNQVLKQIRWKLNEVCAHRVADEVSCITS